MGRFCWFGVSKQGVLGTSPVGGLLNWTSALRFYTPSIAINDRKVITVLGLCGISVFWFVKTDLTDGKRLLEPDVRLFKSMKNRMLRFEDLQFCPQGGELGQDFLGRSAELSYGSPWPVSQVTEIDFGEFLHVDRGDARTGPNWSALEHPPQTPHDAGRASRLSRCVRCEKQKPRSLPQGYSSLIHLLQ